mgnify:FL=1
MDWNKRAKKFLVDVGMAKDERGLIREYRILLSRSIVMLNTYNPHCLLR